MNEESEPKGFEVVQTSPSGERLPKRVYQSSVDGRRYRGRPFTRSMDGVKNMCNARSLEARDVKVKCRDRE